MIFLLITVSPFALLLVFFFFFPHKQLDLVAIGLAVLSLDGIMRIKSFPKMSYVAFVVYN